jgi:hypothetical protein
MKLNLIISSTNGTILEQITIEPHYPKDRPEDHHNLTEVRFARNIVEVLSRRFNCDEDI